MPLANILQGVYDDLEAVLLAYDWEENCRVNNRGIRPTVKQDVDQVGRPLVDQSVVIQLAIERWTELSGGSVALRARVNANFLCVGKTAEVARAILDGVNTVFFGEEKLYDSDAFTTIRKLIPSRCYSTYIQRQENGGYFTQTMVLQAETQFANDN